MSERVIFDTVILFFVLALLANAFALVRHFRMMQVMEIVLNNLIETQRQFDDLMEAERREKS